MAFEKMKKVVDIFRGRDPTMYRYDSSDYYYGSSYRPDQNYYSFVNQKTLVTSIYNRIAVDVSSIDIRHVRINDNDQYETDIFSKLNEALTSGANIDQTSRELIKETVLNMFDDGYAALVPTFTDVDPEKTDSYDVINIRTAKIVEWYPYKVKLDLYREEFGRHDTIILDKRIVPIIYNPFYEIMNERNSTLQRLMKAISQLEKSNGDLTSGKLDLIIQLPYVVKGDAKTKLADQRRESIEKQLTGTKYGIAYVDATEKVIQLNRSLENDLRSQVKDLQTELYNQLGLTQGIFDGTADEEARLNYFNNTIKPILSAITEEIERKWLTKTARTQGQAIRYFNNPFKLIPASQVAELSDKLTRNEIMTSNEIRSILGLKPSKDPKADELRNSNLSHPDNGDTETVPKIKDEETDT